MVKSRLTEEPARARHASGHRLGAEADVEAAVMSTHGLGRLGSSAQADGERNTIGAEKHLFRLSKHRRSKRHRSPRRGAERSKGLTQLGAQLGLVVFPS
ncbi:hypothetical protein [Streptomyces sp. NPDC093097]|uniref:hypothetical protein n=1 Tax=Streptomyces sp. NPDC093097 TaxID=3366027 RepID=UPI0037F8FABF